MRAPWIALLPLVLAAQQIDVDSLQKSARDSYAKGDYQAARKSLEQAWQQVQQSEPKDPKRYDVLKQLSGVLSAAGDYAAAQNYVELAINWRETAISRDDPKLADEWIELATLCQRQKDFARAIALLQRAQYSHTRSDGGESLNVADDFSRMALVYVDDHKAALAAEPLQHAIQIRETVLGAEHPAILSELDRLGPILLNLRDYPQAEDAYRRATVIRERLLGPNDASLFSPSKDWRMRCLGRRNMPRRNRSTHACCRCGWCLRIQAIPWLRWRWTKWPCSIERKGDGRRVPVPRSRPTPYGGCF
jgi:tetratricopeptide (TPR) repeat protein